MKQVIKQKLLELQDEEYKEFNSNLCPNTKNIIGIRIPILRNYAKELLKKYNFVRCHLLYMINVKYIKGIDDKQVFLENNIIIPVSKAYRDEVFKEYRKYRFE